MEEAKADGEDLEVDFMDCLNKIDHDKAFNLNAITSEC
jgi:hypothetical protein